MIPCMSTSSMKASDRAISAKADNTKRHDAYCDMPLNLFHRSRTNRFTSGGTSSSSNPQNSRQQTSESPSPRSSFSLFSGRPQSTDTRPSTASESSAPSQALVAAIENLDLNASRTQAQGITQRPEQLGKTSRQTVQPSAHLNSNSSRPKLPMPPNPAIEDAPPEDLIRDLGRLERATKTSAPDLAKEIAKILKLLEAGLETTENIQGLASFQREIKKMSGWAGEISTESDPEQRDAVLELESILNEVYTALRIEARKGSNRLTFFNYNTDNSDDDDMDKSYDEDDFESFLGKFSLAAKKLKKLLYPTKHTHDQEFLMSNSRIYNRPPLPGTRPSDLSIGSYNQGRQRHEYEGTSYKNVASVASHNDARTGWTKPQPAPPYTPQ